MLVCSSHTAFYKVLQFLFTSEFDCDPVIAEVLKRKVKQRGVRNKQNREDLVNKVQTVLFLLHGPTLKVFHCQGYKQLFTSTSGWEYCISSQGHYFVCLGMQTL